MQLQCFLGYLKSISGLSVQLLRVYSKTVEFEDFPMPGHVATFKTRARLADTVRDRSLQSISLHHLVRDGESPAAQFIRRMDDRIRRCHGNERGLHGNDGPAAAAEDDGIPSAEELELYQAAIKEREKELLMSADVILCTCVAAGASRIRNCTNILQVWSSPFTVKMVENTVAL